MSRFFCSIAGFAIMSTICFGLASDPLAACIRKYKEPPPPTPEELAKKSARDYSAYLWSGGHEAPSTEELEKKWWTAELGTYQDKTDYAVALMLHGDIAQAIDILNAVETDKPGEYVVASNLGTAYELAGDNQKALEWIETGLRREPQSHLGSEWLHVKILQVKLAMERDPAWLSSHSILGLDFGVDDKPVPPTQIVTDIDGNSKTLAEVRSALEYQLRERLSLVPPPDKVVANLLTDLGNLLILDGLPRQARTAYRSAVQFAPADALLDRRANWAARASQRGWTSNRMLVVIACAVVSVIGLATILWLYRRSLRQSYQPSV